MPTINLEKLGTRVAEYSHDLNTTLGAIAGKLGITRVSLWNKLCGKTRFYADELFMLADVLDCDVNDFRN